MSIEVNHNHKYNRVADKHHALDIGTYHNLRRQKYSMKPVLQALDLDNSGFILTDVFIQVALDNKVFLSEKDQSYLKYSVSNQERVEYESVIKDLVLIIEEYEPAIKHSWVLRSNNQDIVAQIKGTENAYLYKSMLKVKKMKKLNLFGYKTQQNFKAGLFNNQDIKQHIDQASLASKEGSLEKASIDSVLENFGPDLQKAIKKITGKTAKPQMQMTQQDWSKQISASSKKINILKNIQNKMFLKQATASNKIQEQKERIRRYMKDNKVDITHLNEILGAFLDCDEERTGIITKKQFFYKIAERNLSFPADFLFNIVKDMQQNENEDENEEANLSYENLKNIIDIYNNCPLFLKGDSNNSDSFKQNMDKNKEMNTSYERIDKLFKYVHLRIEEKFKDFRQAFRNFDKDFGGSLDFKEFITGMENVGIKLKHQDYKIIFDALDFDQQGEIGFFKFCLLNTDRKKDLEKLKREYLARKKDTESQKSSKNSKKPPLHSSLQITGFTQSAQGGDKSNPLFGDGNIPKNKDINNFTKDVYDVTPGQAYMGRRFLRSAQKFHQRTYLDFPDDHQFGLKNQRTHDMVALLTNSYSESLKSISIEELRSRSSKKSYNGFLQSRQTSAQRLRDQAIMQRQKAQGAVVKGCATLVRKAMTPTFGSAEKRRNQKGYFMMLRGKAINNQLQ